MTIPRPAPIHRRRFTLVAGSAALLLAAAVPLDGAQAQDAADLAFWQSIQNSTNPDEYRAYLQAFPNGRFAALARIRIDRPPVAYNPTPGPAPGPAPGPGTLPPTPEPPANDAVAEKIIVDPPTGRVGQVLTFTGQNINDPDPNYSTYDVLVVVPAGTPDFEPNNASARPGVKVVWREYVSNMKSSGWVARGGPFAPGRYEVRYYTTLYNNEHRQEMRTMSPFTVR